MLVPATQLRVGMVVMHNNDPHQELTHVTQGNWRGFVRTKLRNLPVCKTEHRFPVRR
jgi:translation elongation factor P/translation initiation factor 5A